MLAGANTASLPIAVFHSEPEPKGERNRSRQLGGMAVFADTALASGSTTASRAIEAQDRGPARARRRGGGGHEGSIASINRAMPKKYW